MNISYIVCSNNLFLWMAVFLFGEICDNLILQIRHFFKIFTTNKVFAFFPTLFIVCPKRTFFIQFSNLWLLFSDIKMDQLFHSTKLCPFSSSFVSFFRFLDSRITFFGNILSECIFLVCNQRVFCEMRTQTQYSTHTHSSANIDKEG